MNAGVTAFQGAVSSRKQRDRWHSAERKVVQMRAGVSAFQVILPPAPAVSNEGRELTKDQLAVRRRLQPPQRHAAERAEEVPPRLDAPRLGRHE